MSRHGIAAALAVSALAFAGPAAAGVSFLDTGASPSYTIGFEFKADPDVNSNPNICISCGHPGTAIDFEIAVGRTEATAYYGVVVNDSLVYNPHTQGAITAIATSMDKDFSVSTAVNYNNRARLVIKQDGNFYVTVIQGTPIIAPGTTGFLTFSAAGLLATDFQKIDPTTGNPTAGNPDFAGDAITFGVAQTLASIGVPGTLVSAIFDNVAINLTTAAVPEPGTMGLFAAGLGALATLRRRRRSPTDDLTI